MKRCGILILAAIAFGTNWRLAHADDSVAAIDRAAAVAEPVPPAAIEKVTHLDARAIPELLKLARSDQPREAAVAIIALGSIGPAAFDALQQLKPTMAHRPEMVQTAFQVAYPMVACQSKRTLAQAWKNSTTDERGEAGLLMIQMGTRALGPLLETARDADPELRKYALTIANAIVEPGLMRRVLPAMFTGADHDPTALRKILTAHRNDIEIARADREDAIRTLAEDLLRVADASNAHK